MVPFGGWDMPVQYSGIIDEHRSVRTAVGVFDVSHMGRFVADGPGAFGALQYALTNDLVRLQPGQSQYSLLLRESGGIADDLYVYRTGHESYLLVVNASNTPKDWALFVERSRRIEGCRLDDVTESQAMLAVQGPRAISLLDRLTDGRLSSIPRLGNQWITVCAIPVLACRTGYTGEDGAELIVPGEHARKLWDAIVEAGAKPCGLGARDTLRLEAAYPLYGNDIDETTSPLEAGLEWAVVLDKGEFVGREALVTQKKQGVHRRLICFVMEGRGIARSHYRIVADGEDVGVVTSGSFAPTLRQNIGLGYVRADLAKAGTGIAVMIRDQPVPARVVKRPFVKNV